MTSTPSATRSLGREQAPAASAINAHATAARRLSVVIPVLNEEATLPATLEHLSVAEGVACIVADGGSTDATVAVAQSAGAHVVATSAGRAIQMNAGAAAARELDGDRDLLLFLHADTHLPDGYADAIAEALDQSGVAGGAFAFAVDGQGARFRLMERLVNWRSRVRQCPYGDQGLFTTVSQFDALNGFVDLPVMEDVDLVERLRRRGRIATADVIATTSARRYGERGFVRTTASHAAMMLAWKGGLSPNRIARWRR